MNWHSHATEEVLEGYSLGTLSDAEVESLEEHLLICGECQERLRHTDAYVLAMKQAAAELRQPRASWAADAWHSFRRRLAWPEAAAGLALAVVLLLLVARPWGSGPAPDEPAVLVQLAAFRGGDLPGAEAPAGKPLLLRIDTAGLPPSATYRVEVVDARGQPVYAGSCGSAGGDVPLRQSLRAGRYWVRVAQPTAQRELLREFGLDLK